MKDELKRHKDRLTEREAQYVWRGIRDRAFRPRKRRSWKPVWVIGTPVAVAAAALLIFVVGRGPQLDVRPSDLSEVSDLSDVSDGSDLSDKKQPGTDAFVLPEPEKGPRVSDRSDVSDVSGRPEVSDRSDKSGGRLALVGEKGETPSAIDAMTPESPKTAAPREKRAGTAEEKLPGTLSEKPVGTDAEKPPGTESEKPAGTEAGVIYEAEEGPTLSDESDLSDGSDLSDRSEPKAIAQAPVPVSTGRWHPGKGRITGRVTDAATGDPLAYANVIVEGTQMGAASRPDGKYEILNVEPGTYRLKVQMMGYADAARENVRVKANRATVVDFALQVVVFNTIQEVDAVKRGKDIHLEASGPGRTIETNDLKVRGGRSSKIMYGANGAQAMQPAPAGETGGYPMAHGGVVPPNGEPVDAMFFKQYGTNPFIAAEDDNLSTFAIDVDTGSYTVSRAYLEGGNLPPQGAVRVEEFINFFDHDYDPPRRGDFAIHLEAAPSQFGEDLILMRVGLKAREVDERERKRANLVFVIDTSGSMKRENRLGLVKRALFALLDELGDEDSIGIIEYGSNGREVLRPTSVRYRDDIERAIEGLRPDGSTYAEEGLRMGYEMADRIFDRDANNRVILCSDGVANVGRTGAEGILKTIKEQARRGIFMTAVGFGMGNYNDVLMEQLADHGDGHYYYVDEMREARRVFTENLTATLETIARDTKVQVEFDPDTVKRYRLLGYENRDVADEDFRNDKVDAGEVGAGHTVTALYEVRLYDDVRKGELAKVHLRWENPESGKVTEIDEKIDVRDVHGDFNHSSWSFQRDAAVAEFAEILRHSYWAKGSDLRNVEDLVDRLADDREADRETLELLDLVEEARRLWKDEVWTNEWRGGED